MILLPVLKVDKDFVWTLWKEAKHEMPDVSGVIKMVTSRWGWEHGYGKGHNVW